MVCFFSLFYSSIALIWGARFVNKRQTLTAVPNKQAQFKPVRLMVPKKNTKECAFVASYCRFYTGYIGWKKSKTKTKGVVTQNTCMFALWKERFGYLGVLMLWRLSHHIHRSTHGTTAGGKRT